MNETTRAAYLVEAEEACYNAFTKACDKALARRDKALGEARAQADKDYAEAHAKALGEARAQADKDYAEAHAKALAVYAQSRIDAAEADA